LVCLELDQEDAGKDRNEVMTDMASVLFRLPWKTKSNQQ
jgi:hypothetical protein